MGFRSGPAWLAQASSMIQGVEVTFEGVNRSLEHAAFGVDAADVKISLAVLTDELDALWGEQRVDGRRCGRGGAGTAVGPRRRRTEATELSSGSVRRLGSNGQPSPADPG